MRRFLWVVGLLLLGLSACTSFRSASKSQPLTNEQPALAATTEQPAQAQTSAPPTELPATSEATEFQAAKVLKTLEAQKTQHPDGLASTNRRLIPSELRKPLGLSKVVLKMAEKQVVKAVKKRRPAQQDGTILGMSPVLFFALVAVLVGVILLFVAGKSQFFSILTVVLLVGGLLVALASFLDII